MATLIKNRQKKIKIDLPRLRRSLKLIGQCLECGDKEISVLLVDNETIREMNRDYLGRDYPTNVISFSLCEGKFGDINPSLLGDVVISVERALTDAGKACMDFADELDFLAIHGILHLLGYNHEANASPEETSLMQKREKTVFFRLNGYWPYRVTQRVRNP